MSAKKILITSSIFLMALAATVPASAASRYTTTLIATIAGTFAAWHGTLF